MTTRQARRAEKISELFNSLQVVRFQIEAIVANPQKQALNQARASSAVKRLKHIEVDMRELLGMASQEDIRSAVAEAQVGRNDHLGSREKETK